MWGASSVSQADSMASTSRISYLHTHSGKTTVGLPIGASRWLQFQQALQQALQELEQTAGGLEQGAGKPGRCLLMGSQGGGGSPAAVVLLGHIEQDPLGAAAEEDARVVDAQLCRRRVAAGGANQPVDRGPRVVLVWGGGGGAWQ